MGHEYRSGCAFSSTGRNRYRVLARIGRPTGVRWDSIWTDHQEEAFLTSTHLCIATTSIPAGVTSRHAPPVAIVASTPLPNRNSR
jgi:hypothetical protein